MDKLGVTGVIDRMVVQSPSTSDEPKGFRKGSIRHARLSHFFGIHPDSGFSPIAFAVNFAGVEHDSLAPQ